jgi:hypothetical protein
MAGMRWNAPGKSERNRPKSRVKACEPQKVTRVLEKFPRRGSSKSSATATGTGQGRAVDPWQGLTKLGVARPRLGA